MAKIEIIGPRELSADVMSVVHQHGRLHIEDLTSKIDRGELPLDHMVIGDSGERCLDDMDELLVRVRAILKALSRDGDAVDPNRVRIHYQKLNQYQGRKLCSEVEQLIRDVEERAGELADAASALEMEDAQLDRYEPVLAKIQPLAQQVVMSTDGYDSVALLFERRYRSVIESLREEIERITHHQCDFMATDVDQDTTAVIVVFARKHSDSVHKFLTLENVNQIRLPAQFSDVPFDAALDQVRARRNELPGELARVNRELSGLSRVWGDRLSAARDVLVDRVSEIEAIPKMGRTEYAFVITGWVPVRDLRSLTELMRSRWGSDVIVEQLEISDGELPDIPVALSNPRSAEPFQRLLGVYGLPRYGTIDPTWMLLIFYPLFFGMIVGDVGYGLIMLGIVLWLRWRNRDNPLMQLATSILGPAATMVVVFGFLYGEFFGDLLGERYLGWIQKVSLMGVSLPFERTHLVIPFMLIAVGVGIVHVLLGLVLGVVNAIRTRSRTHLWEKGGILAFLLGVGVAVLMSLPVTTDLLGSWALWIQIVFAGLAFAGFVFALRGGQIMGAIELIESVAHMASYIRIMAVGLAGAIFADAVNEIVAEMGLSVMAVVVAVLLHALNFVISAFSPTIHALRLNFLEFFGKFYETGGKPYEPFAKTGGE